MTRAALIGLMALAAATGETVVVENNAIKLTTDLEGGGFVDFQLKSRPLNPFTWEDKGKPAPKFRGHFLCLDRWGQPSAAELANGMPFHGEAPLTVWRGTGSEMEVALPMAGLRVKRSIRLQDASVLVRESVTNANKLGRVFNMVQHPTIGPPFLDESTVVDSNARRGFMQSSPLPNPEQPTVVWPQALKDGQPVNLRHLTNDPDPNVVSYVVDEPYGWTTATNAGRGLLLGYVWKTEEYPWFNVWRHVENGKPYARGLEFGTTGLHQPFPVLTRKGRIFDRPLFSFLDAGETSVRSFQMFYAPVSAEVTAVTRMSVEAGEFIFETRGGQPIRVPNLLR